MADAAEVFDKARILAEVVEHRHPGRADPGVVSLRTKREQFKGAVHIAERRVHDGELQVLDVFGFRASFQFRKAGPGLIGPSSARKRPGVITEVERGPVS